jgi:hypothetical protein
LPDASDNALPRRRPGVRLILAAGIVAMTMWQLVLHLRIIVFAYPLDYRENTDFYRAIAQGKSRWIRARPSF